MIFVEKTVELALVKPSQVIPGMVDRGKGTILFTGCSASLNGIAGYSELCNFTESPQATLQWWNAFLRDSVKIFLPFPLVFPFKQTGCGKFALRALSQSLAREFQPVGVHVAHVIIDGVVGPPRFLPFLIFF